MILLAASTTSWLMTGVVSVALFATVVLAIYGLFNQPVEVRLSYQREAAILAGDTDRRTAFETPVLQPILWVLLAFASSVALPRTKRRIERYLVASGNPNYYSVNEYLALSLLGGAGAVACVILASYVLDVGLVMFALAFVLGTAFPIVRLRGQARRRVREISKRIPYSLDLIALSMGAGATFTEAVSTLVREDPADEFNRELGQVLAEVELGKTRNEALAAMTDRIPLDSLRMIIGAIIQAESLGTPLTDVLKAQSNLLRHQRSVRAEKLAATASVRILVPSVVILASVVLVVFAPILLRYFRGELF